MTAVNFIFLEVSFVNCYILSFRPTVFLIPFLNIRGPSLIPNIFFNSLISKIFEHWLIFIILKKRHNSKKKKSIFFSLLNRSFLGEPLEQKFDGINMSLFFLSFCYQKFYISFLQ